MVNTWPKASWIRINQDYIGISSDRSSKNKIIVKPRSVILRSYKILMISNCSLTCIFCTHCCTVAFERETYLVRPIYSGCLHLSSTSPDRIWWKTSFGLTRMWLHWPSHFGDLIFVDDLGVLGRQKYNNPLFVPLSGTLYLSGDQADRILRLFLGRGKLRDKSCWNESRHGRFHRLCEIRYFYIIFDCWVQFHAISGSLNSSCNSKHLRGDKYNHVAIHLDPKYHTSEKSLSICLAKYEHSSPSAYWTRI